MKVQVKVFPWGCIFEVGRDSRRIKMKTWLKKFFKGTYVGCWMLIMVGVVFIVLRVGVMVTMIFGALLARIEPTVNNIIILICLCFVVFFGVMWSTLEK